MRRRHTLPLLLWTLAWFLFFLPLIIGGARLPNSDFSGQFHAFGLFQAREVSAGHLPVWSPGSYAGFPFAADPQSAVFYPLRWLAILFSLPWGFTYQALQLEGLLHIWLAGVFAYFLAHDITQERWSGLIAALALGLGGYLTSYPLLQLAVLETFAWLPLVLLLLRWGVRRERPLPYLLAAGATLGVSALAGHPQTFLHAGYLAAAYFLFLAGQAHWEWRWRLGLGAAIAVTAVGVALASWLPAWRYLARTTRSETGYEFVAKGFPLLDYWQILVPGPFSLWAPQYVGVTAVLLVLIAWWGRQQGRRAEIFFWFGAAFLAAWLSLGDKGILFELVYHIAPGFSLFRQQERLINVVSLSLALLAAQGLAIWLKAAAPQRRNWLRRTAIALALGLILAAVVLAGMRAAVPSDWPAILLRQGVITAVALLILRQVKQCRWLGLSLALLLGIDLYLAVLPTLNLQKTPRIITPQQRNNNGSADVPSAPDAGETPALPFSLAEETGGFWQQPDWLAAIQTGEPARIDSGHLFHANVGEAYGLEDIGGISPLKPQVLDALESLPRQRLWQLLNVQYVLSDQPLDENGHLQQIATIDDSLLPGETAAGFVYENESALPRAWMSYQAIAAPDAAAALEQLQNPDLNSADTVVLHPPLPDLSQIAPPDGPPRVDVVRRQANELAITVTTESPGLLVLSEWSYPGWRATVNGRAATLYPANYAFQSLLLPAGTHQISLRFQPVDVIIGSIAALITVLAAAFIAWRWQPMVSLRQTNPAPALLPHWPRPQSLTFNHQSFTFLQKRWRILFLFLLGFGLRVFRLGHQELRGDEAFSYLYAGHPASEIVGDLLRVGDTHSPLHYFLLHGWQKLTGDSEFALRFLSLIPAVLLIALLYRLGKLMGGRRVGMLTAVFITTAQSQIWLAQDVRNQYTMMLFFTALTTWLLVRIAQSKRLNLLQWAAYSLSAVLAVYSHYFAIFGLLAHGLFLLADPARRRWLWAWIGSGLTAAALFSVWIIPMGQRLISTGQVNDPSQPELARHLTAVGIELTAGSAVSSGLMRWLFLGALVLCLLGVKSLWVKRRGWALLLIGWLGGAALGIFLIRYSRATFNSYYINVAGPAWWLLVASGIIALSRRPRWQWLAPASIIILLGVSAVSLRNYYFDPAYSRTRGYRAIAAHIAAAASPNDLFLAHFPDPSLDYYLRDVSLSRTMQPARSGETAVETEAALAQLTDSYDRIWFVPAHNSVWDPEDVVPHWLEFHTLHEQRLRFDHLELLAYRPPSQIDAVTTPVNAVLENGITLHSLLVTVDGRPVAVNQPVAIVPEATIEVTLIWQAPQPIAQDYTVFVHFLAADGRLVAQHDGVPAAGTRPTTTWPAGDLVLDWHELGVVGGGNGRVVVGMYDNQTLTRQQFANGQDAYPIMQTIPLQ